jgi:hypothetical protein
MREVEEALAKKREMMYHVCPSLQAAAQTSAPAEQPAATTAAQATAGSADDETAKAWAAYYAQQQAYTAGTTEGQQVKTPART